MASPATKICVCLTPLVMLLLIMRSLQADFTRGARVASGDELPFDHPFDASRKAFHHHNVVPKPIQETDTPFSNIEPNPEAIVFPQGKEEQNAEGDDISDSGADGERDTVNTPDYCDPDRKPFHVILTAQAQSLYQEWQTRTMHYHFQKQQRSNPCTEMTGFTRVLASRDATPDGLMDEMNTFVTTMTDMKTNRGFQVINRPWSMLQFIESGAFDEMVKEEYVYIAETDHLLMRDLKNLATKDEILGFYFPYMEPENPLLIDVVQKYYDGDPKNVDPVGPSPVIVHRDTLKAVVQGWYDLSVELKHDGRADSALGWALEMWGWSITCARKGYKHKVWQQFQIEPSASWHQNVTVEDPYIYHHTFGIEYSLDGIAMVGQVGEWSLDKRTWSASYPPVPLLPPPACAGECATVLSGLFNEAWTALKARGTWNNMQVGPNTDRKSPSKSGASGGGGGAGEAAVGALTSLGSWSATEEGALDLGSAKFTMQKLMFFRNGFVYLKSPDLEGVGKFEMTGPHDFKLHVCNKQYHGSFASTAEADCQLQAGADGGLFRPSACAAAVTLTLKPPPSHSRSATDDATLVARLHSTYPAKPASEKFTAAEAAAPIVQELEGTGPWAWAGVMGIGFFRGGVLETLWGQGNWGPVKKEDGSGWEPKKVYMDFAGQSHIVTFADCHQFDFVRVSDGDTAKGWMQIPETARFNSQCSRGLDMLRVPVQGAPRTTGGRIEAAMP